MGSRKSGALARNALAETAIYDWSERNGSYLEHSARRDANIITASNCYRRIQKKCRKKNLIFKKKLHAIQKKYTENESSIYVWEKGTGRSTNVWKKGTGSSFACGKRSERTTEDKISALSTGGFA